jgi:hypothetical protein
MSNLQDCLQEVIARGPGYFIRGSLPTGAYQTTEWEPAEFLALLQRESPGVLADHAWTEWHTHPSTGARCYIHYGRRDGSLGHQGVPGYGRLCALELSERQQPRMSASLFGSSADDGH